VNVAFFGADAVYWQIRFEASAGGVPNRVMVCYKDATKDPVQGPTTTVEFRQSPVNRPEQTLMGLQFTSQTQNNGYVSYVVNNSSHWIYAGTGFKDGNTVSGIVGYETDHQFSNFPLPNSVAGSYTLLSRSTYTNYNGASDWANSSIYQAPSGAWVFDAGTIGWSWGLDNYGSHNIADTRIQQTTANLLNKFIGSSPSPPPAIAAPSGLTATAPSSTMVNLAWTDNATNETAYTVERSPDGSTNWTVLASVLAAGATSYSDTTVSALTTYYYRVKATTATSSSNYSNTANITTPGTAPPPPPSSGTSLFIYRDALASGWENWSWGSTLNLTNANPVYAGTASIAFTATGSYGGLYLHNSTGVDTTAYTALSFAAQASQSGQHYGILLYDANSQPLSAVMPLANLGGDPQAGSWTVYTIPLSSLNGAGKLVKGAVIQSSGASAQPALYVDEIGFAGTASSPPPPPTSPPPPPPPPPTGGITVFGDSLAAGWQNWSWSSTINFSNTNPVYAGTASIAFTATGPWGGLYLHTDTAVDTTSVSTLSFAVRASQTGQKYQVALYDANNQLLKATVPLGNYGGDPPPDTWKVYAIPLADLNGAGKLVKGILIQEALGQAQPALYVDELGFR